ncbi:hypothetical protein JVT61DRAFT_3129 [Boletus reticuloceps]|uniref:Uncharacterized protein n=1 Tax=Boletus reticuloceps TaxID=495285 RepID=A0A8I2YMJ6_9AGAM|nr:hypothetical protein JVT61DRAFT_3129 [Boletus reticuloceps]
MRTDEQILHDRINLSRLIKRLEQSIQEDDWSKSDPPKRETWLKAQATLQVRTRPTAHVELTDEAYQQLRHARLLLKNVELDNVDPTPAQERRYQHFKMTLKHLEDYMLQVNQVRRSPIATLHLFSDCSVCLQQLTPPVRRPKPLLPSIRPPPPRSPTSKSSEPTTSPVEVTLGLIPAEASPSLAVLDVQDLLLASPHISSPSSSSLASSPASIPAPGQEPGPSHTSSPPRTLPRPTLLHKNNRHPNHPPKLARAPRSTLRTARPDGHPAPPQRHPFLSVARKRQGRHRGNGDQSRRQL